MSVDGCDRHVQEAGYLRSDRCPGILGRCTWKISTCCDNQSYTYKCLAQALQIESIVSMFSRRQWYTTRGF
jgi:hypothetical protein